ncbi:NACHT domain-containing protein [Maribacter dokdonensis]|uniref:NACHT domain-containing protein n=1 Tax=Maribacter dokdonensis TaxID=320912 RepID=UPI001C08946A|nr:NACHT domain-containing protein [Maribacter dokdonensis]MBU2901314.1 NACHT domain-containing protein [Maribacter dokdonensis]
MEKNIEVTSLITPILDGLKFANNEAKALLEIGIPEYLHNQTEKYYYTNTFLHRAEKVKFDDIYFPVSVGYKDFTTKFDDIEKVFEEYKYITIIGSAGSGKSTLIKHLFLNSIRKSYKIPILIELRYLNEYIGSVTDFIYEKILINDVKPSKNTLIRALKKGAFLFLFDGYDEIFSNRKQQISKEIDDFTDVYPNNKYLITTRPGGGIEGTQRFHSFLINDLSSSEITDFINLLVDDPERREQIKNNIDKSEVSDYREYLKNPLLLSMFILAFENHPEIPSRKSAFYKNVFDTLYSKHDGVTKSSFPREKKTKLKREDFEDILSVFSFTSIAEGKFAFTEEYLSDKLSLIQKKKQKMSFEIEDIIFDFRTSISIMIKDGFEFKFPHRSMQEYFTAYFLSKLPSEKKLKGYTRISRIFNKSSEDYSLNLWKLCKELDNSNYYKYFVIPELEKAVEILEGNEGVNLLNAFFKLWEPTLFLVRFVPDKKHKLVIARSSNLYSTIIDDESIYNYKDFCYFPNKNGMKNKILDIVNYEYNKEQEEFMGAVSDINTNDEIKEVLIENGILKVIQKYDQKIKKRIIDINKELSREDLDLDDLLEG